MNNNKEKILTMLNWEEEKGIHIVTNHTGKMQGMYSLSTSCLENKYCLSYSEDIKSICSKCYSISMLKNSFYKRMIPLLKRNTEIFTSRVLDENELPYLNAAYFRLEAFGDLQNETQMINYINLCKKNKDTSFALWTKNPFIIEKVLSKGIKKPKNLIIVLSSRFYNTVADKDKYDFVDKVFTVYEKNYIKENDVDINCGSKKCIQCLKCYKKNSCVYINEMVK